MTSLSSSVGSFNSAQTSTRYSRSIPCDLSTASKTVNPQISIRNYSYTTAPNISRQHVPQTLSRHHAVSRNTQDSPISPISGLSTPPATPPSSSSSAQSGFYVAGQGPSIPLSPGRRHRPSQSFPYAGLETSRRLPGVRELCTFSHRGRQEQAPADGATSK